MNLPTVLREASIGVDRRGREDAHLRGSWLVLARVLWSAIFMLTLVVFCANLVVGKYDPVTTTLLVANVSMWFAVSLVLFWRKASDRAILLFSLQLVLTTGFFIPRYPGLLVNDGAWWIPIDLLALLAGSSLSFVYMFPDGRFVPGFTRWLALGWIATSVVPVFFFGASSPWNYWLSPFYTLVRSAFYGSLALALLYRYRRVTTPLQRQQIKWVVFASVIVVADVSVASLLSLLPASSSALDFLIQFHQLVRSITSILPVLFPLSIGIALLRYRLWDIDLIINRALVYAALTGTLALVYFTLIIALQFLVRSLTGQGSQPPLVIVASTLAIAALFQPLRQRIQSIIDRRLYRSKYDAERTLAAFSATLRSEVDLNELSGHLLAVVEETMQPTFVSLWLRLPDHGKAR